MKKDVALQAETTSPPVKGISSRNYFSIDTCNISSSVNTQESIYRPSVCLSLVKKASSEFVWPDSSSKKTGIKFGISIWLYYLTDTKKPVGESEMCLCINCNVVRARATLHTSAVYIQCRFSFCSVCFECQLQCNRTHFSNWSNNVFSVRYQL